MKTLDRRDAASLDVRLQGPARRIAAPLCDVRSGDPKGLCGSATFCPRQLSRVLANCIVSLESAAPMKL